MSSWNQLPALASSEVAIAFSYEAVCQDAVTPAPRSPIDEFYSYRTELITLSALIDREGRNDAQRLLLLGIVSSAEAYVREVMTRLLVFCPRCRAAAAEQVLQFGAVHYYQLDELPRALVEGVSLAGEKELRAKVQKLLGFQLPSVGSIATALREFDELCELRHASVHSHGALGSANARALGLERPANRRHSVVLTAREFQDLVVIATNLVRTMNGFLSEKVLSRWVDGHDISGDWAADKPRFELWFRLFHSSTDRPDLRSAHQVYRRIRAEILTRTTT